MLPLTGVSPSGPLHPPDNFSPSAANVHSLDNELPPSEEVTVHVPAIPALLALAAVFSAEVSTCDAILYMLSTSSSMLVVRARSSSVARACAANDFMYWEVMRRAGGRGTVGTEGQRLRSLRLTSDA